MKKVIFCIIIAAAAFSCTKNPTLVSPGSSASSLWPLKAGNTWVYQDSVLNPTGPAALIYADTISVTNKTYNDPSGITFYGIQDNTYGFFASGNYIAVDPSNTAIYMMDSLSSSPYVFFATSNQDGALLGSANDFSNPLCVGLFSQYGFVTPTTINGYSCLKNIEYNTDCNNATKEVIVTYVSAGVGVVRMEDYEQNPATNSLYLDYSQTLQSYKLN